MTSAAIPYAPQYKLPGQRGTLRAFVSSMEALTASWEAAAAAAAAAAAKESSSTSGGIACTL